MAEMKLIENGIRKSVNGRKKRRSSRKRSNGITALAKPVARKRSNGVSKAGALGFAKKNGLKLVSRSVSNGRKKKRSRRRNGISAVRTRSNGLFGDSTALIKKTLTLTGGAVATNVGGNWLATLLAPYLASFGLGAYTPIITQALIAQFGVPYLAKMLKQDGDMARLGGFLSVVLTLLNQVFPQFASLNPFASTPLVVNSNGQVALTGDAVNTIAKAAAADTAAKIGQFTNQLTATNGSLGWSNPNAYIQQGDVNAIM